MKMCTKCKVTQPFEQFRKRKTGRYFSHCRACDNRRSAAWQAANPERARKISRECYHRNQETKVERARRDRREKPEASRAAVRKWRAANTDTANLATRRWAANNPERCRENETKRKASKLNATPAWADHALMRDIYAYAAIMRRAGVTCHVDHMVPLQSKQVCGFHTHDNLTVLPARDNQVKGNRHWPDGWGSTPGG